MLFGPPPFLNDIGNKLRGWCRGAHRVRQQQTCALDVMLFTEQVPRADAIMSSLFPVNALRCSFRPLRRDAAIRWFGQRLVPTAFAGPQ